MVTTNCLHHPDGCGFSGGICHCGCGEKTEPSRGKVYVQGERLPRGYPKQFAPGHLHHNRSRVPPEDLKRVRKNARLYYEQNICPHCGESCEVGAGHCHCGCGKETVPAQHTRTTGSRLVGVPNKYLHGHTGQRKRLTRQQVREIRYLYATDDTWTQVKLAKRYHIAQSTVASIVIFKTWKNAGIATEEEMKESIVASTQESA